MTTTQERILLLTEACSHHEIQQWTGAITAHDLHTWVSSELGSNMALDAFLAHGPLQSKAIAPPCILHIVSGNTAHAAFQSIIRGLLIGSHNVVKLPSAGLAKLTNALKHFPSALRELIEIRSSLEDQDWSRADVIIAIGSDESIAAIHQHTKPHQIFIPHSHKVSIGLVYDDFEAAAIHAARDVSLYNQRGCLSLHAIYVAGDSERFADLLAIEMGKFSQSNPAESLTASEAGAIRNLRESTRFRSSNDPEFRLLESSDSLDWTVIHDPSTLLELSCLNRCVYVKPLPSELNTAKLGPEAEHLSTIAIHPFTQENAVSLEHLPAHRICPLGQSQQPSLFWHHDGFAPLASLVKWKDIG